MPNGSTQSARSCTKSCCSFGSAGEAVGLYRVSADAIRNADLPTRLGESPPQDYYEDAFDRALRAAGPDALDMAAIDVTGFACVEVDDADDYAAARAAVLPPPPPDPA